MKRAIKKTIRLFLSPLVLPGFLKFKRMGGARRFTLRSHDLNPQIKDATVATGFDRHYVYHTAWAARVLAETRPEKHTDISSSLYFAGIVSAFVPIEFYDYRPADLELSGLRCGKADLMKLPFPDGSVQSLSSMHVVEHIGLGRYGDPLDPDGDKKACDELARVLAPDGNLLFVVPVATRAKIEWNAHRIYTFDAVLKLFPDLKLEEFALIPEKTGAMVRNANLAAIVDEYACGCFRFTKQ